MSALDDMRADIVQTIYANGVVLEESQGSMALAKPNLCAGKSTRRFRKLSWQSKRTANLR